MEFISNLYKGLATRILDNMAEIIMVDLWNGQTEPFFGDENNLALPAVFVDIRALNIRTLGNNLQDLTIRATFHVAVNSLQDTRVSRNTGYNISAIHRLTAQLHNLMQGFQSDFFEGAMRRTAIYPYEAATNVLQIAQAYEFQVVDASAKPDYDTVVPAEGIIIEKNIEPKEKSSAFTVEL